MRRFSLLLLISGLGALIAAVLWWFLFWRAVVKRLGEASATPFPVLPLKIPPIAAPSIWLAT